MKLKLYHKKSWFTYVWLSLMIALGLVIILYPPFKLGNIIVGGGVVLLMIYWLWSYHKGKGLEEEINVERFEVIER